MTIFGTDFDDCLLIGDVADGSFNFVGMIEYLYSKTGQEIPENLRMVPSPLYPTLDVFKAAYDEQLALNNTNGYLLPLEAFENQDENVSYWAKQQWKDAFQYYLNPPIVSLLKKKSVHNDIYIISGSPSIYIEPVKDYLPFPVVVLSVEQGEIITSQIGKTNRLKNIDSTLQQVTGYIGETWKNDGPLLSTLANTNGSQNLYFVCHNSAQCDKNTRKNLCRYNITKLRLPDY
jgi:hypothetical protein